MSILHASVVALIQSIYPKNIVLSTLNETTNVFSPSITSSNLSDEVLSVLQSIESWWSIEFEVESGDKVSVTRWNFDNEMEMFFLRINKRTGSDDAKEMCVTKEVVSGMCGVSDSLTNGFTPHFMLEKEAIEYIKEFVETNIVKNND